MAKRLQVLPRVIAAATARQDVIDVVAGDDATFLGVPPERVAAERVRAAEQPSESLPAPAVAAHRWAVTRWLVHLARR